MIMTKLNTMFKLLYLEVMQNHGRKLYEDNWLFEVSFQGEDLQIEVHVKELLKLILNNAASHQDVDIYTLYDTYLDAEKSSGYIRYVG